MIQKFSVEITVNSTAEAKRIQKEILSLINTRIKYALDKLIKE